MNQRQQRIRHLRNDSITSADQGAGGYRGSCYGGSSSSGDHRGNNRLGEALHDSFGSSNNRSSEQLQRNYHYHQQQQQEQSYHDASENANFESYYSPQRNGRHPQQTSRRAVNTARAGHRHQSLTLPITHKSNNLQENVRRQRGYGSYNETLLNQSGRDINEGPGEDDDYDKLDNIPLVSSEYMKELTSRTPHSNMKNNTDESDRSNRLDPNNNSYRVLRQSVENNVESDGTGDNIDRINSPSFNMPGHRRRESDNSNQSSQTSHTRRTGWDRNIRQQRQLPPQSQPSQNYTHRRTSSSSTSFNQSLPQIHRTSNFQTVPHQNQLSHHNPKRRASISGTSSPLFQKVDGFGLRNSMGGDDGHNGAFLRHSTGGSGGGGYDQGVIMPIKQQNKSAKIQKKMFESYRRLSSGDAAVAGVDDGGSAGNVLASLTSDVSVSVNKRKKKICMIAAVFIVVVIAIVATVVYFVTSQSSDVRSEQVQLGNFSSSPQTVTPEIDIALDCKDCISKPVSDIEGRCAPSNLPFSLSACEEACKDAACCYSDFEGDKCYDESNEATLLACAQYKPHCDVLYRPWAGATDGIIPAAPVSLFEGSDWDEICGTGPTDQRKLSNYTETLTCVEFCLPAKCCFAPIIQSDLAGQGLVLSQDFAYQSLATAEYVMTSCTPKNHKSCSDYAEPCRDLLEPLSFWQNAFVSELPTYDDTPNPTSALSSATSTNKPTLQPAPQLPIAVVTPRPSQTTQRPMKEPTNEPSTVPAPVQGATASPSTPPTTSPTAIKLAPPIPVANLAEIKESCTGMDNYNLIAKGEFNARTKCRNACLEGLCCYVDLGLGNEESCFVGNEDICAGYADCLVLKAKPNDVILQNDSRPPAPIDDLNSLCSLESIATTTGLSNCYQACLPGSCCGVIDEASCFNEYEADCLAYAPCQRMVDQYGGDSSISLPPIPPSNLQHACSYSSLSSFHQSSGDVLTECDRMCDVGMCCLDDDGCGDGMIGPDAELLDRCTEYEPCRNLQPLSMPPDNIELMCQDKQSSECLKACEVASCCFSTEDNCFVNFELICQEFIPYCAPNISGGDFPASLSPPPPDLCTQGPPSLCRNTCQAASCCFASSVEDNCFMLNEEVRSSCCCYYCLIIISSSNFVHSLLRLRPVVCMLNVVFFFR